jgi:hypothetical protein
MTAVLSAALCNQWLNDDLNSGKIPYYEAPQ